MESKMTALTLISRTPSEENLPELLRPKSDADLHAAVSKKNSSGSERRSAMATVCCCAADADDIDERLIFQDELSFQPVMRKAPCRRTCLFDPVGCFSYCWLCVVSVAFYYNLWVTSYRFAFNEITWHSAKFWLPLDYSADVIYILDVVIGLRTAYFNEGVLQTRPKAIRHKYVNSTAFYLDCLCLLPLDVLYLSFGFKSAVRCIRLVKVWKCHRLIEITERHTNHPFVLRCALLLNVVLLTVHWNACVMSYWRVPGTPLPQTNHTHLHNYLAVFATSCQTILLAKQPVLDQDTSTFASLLSISQNLVGFALYAVVIGYWTVLVTNRNNERKQFHNDLHGVKDYLRERSVPVYLQIKVIRWFDYLWRCRGNNNDLAALDCLPNRLKAEIAIQVHLNTLKRVAIFRNTEPGFLCELVLRLKPMLFSPGDYVCRKGEVGKEMYIVDKGRLNVLKEDNNQALATLTAGSYFGEISVLNLGSVGNRRTASVVSVGYSELLCLSKRDISEVLEDYPTARDRLEEIARKRLNDIRQGGKHSASVSGWPKSHKSSLAVHKASQSRVVRRRSVPVTLTAAAVSRASLLSHTHFIGRSQQH